MKMSVPRREYGVCPICKKGVLKRKAAVHVQAHKNRGDLGEDEWEEQEDDGSFPKWFTEPRDTLQGGSMDGRFSRKRRP